MKKDSLTQVLIKFTKVHENTYNYSEVKYVNSRTKVIIICKDHGEFSQLSTNHILGQGCPKCKGVRKITHSEVIKNFIEKHGNLYNYSKVKYINNKTKVIIICKDHGEFSITPNAHLSGQGCKICGNKKHGLLSKKSQQTYINECLLKHGDLYNYSKVKYINNNSKVIIICKKHGEFSQRAANHLSGYHCPKCAQITRSKKLQWNMLSKYTKNIKIGLQPGIFYVLKFKHKKLNFEFIKVGITSRTIKTRYGEKKYKDYKYSVLQEINCTNLESAQLEKEFLMKTKKRFKFPDNINFSGKTECFNLSDLSKYRVTEGVL